MPDAPSPHTYALDRQRVRAAFERAAATYDAAAVLQREIAERLLTRLDLVKLKPQSILDIGCGTGYATRKLAKRYRQARVLGMDIAHAMTTYARKRSGPMNSFTQRCTFVCGDAERLPFANACVDMVVSNLSLQWCSPPAVFAEAMRVLRPGGLLMFTTFGPDTLHELRAAWRAVDDRPHVHGFLDMHDLGDMLVHAGFADPVMDMERFTLTYESVMHVMRDLKQLGAHNVTTTRARGLTGKGQFLRFRTVYEAMTQAGRIPATYEAVYGHAWAPESRLARPGEPVAISIYKGIGGRPR